MKCITDHLVILMEVFKEIMETRMQINLTD